MAIPNPCALLKRLLSEGKESPWLEFKLNCPDEQELGSYVSALSNSAMLQDKDRAFIVFGIEDGTLKRTGTKVKLATLKVRGEGLQNWLARVIDPPLKLEFHDFNCDGLDFAIIEIEPSYYKPVKSEGTAYIRIGEHKKKLADQPEFERSLWLATGRRKFEDAIAASNVSASQVLQLLNAKPFYELRSQPFPESAELVLRNFLDNKIIYDELDGTYSITNLGAMLLATDISQFPSVSRKTVRVIQYRGIDISSAHPEIEGKMGYAVGFEGLIDFVSQKIERRETIVSGVRRNVPMIPSIAIREFIANALIHQDLSAEGSGPIIEIFSNRIEISNPGGPLGEISRLIDDAPRSRNEKLARAMRDLNLCEERGRGLDKSITAIEAFSTIEKINMPAPSFRATTSGFVATLFGPRPFRELTKEDRMRACYQHCVLGYLKGEYMSNSTLRSRFSLEDDDYQAVSAVISDSLRNNLIVPADAKQGRRNSRYVPMWAKTNMTA